MERTSTSRARGSSSSSASTDPSPIGLLRESLDVLAAEHPEVYAALTRRLAGQRVAIQIDAEAVTLSFTPGRHAAGVGPADVSLETDRATVRALLAGATSLLDAVLTERLRLRAPADRLDRLHEGIVLYLRGAARCPSFPALLARLGGTHSLRRSA